jgi:reactive intermediate/imine deaminase
VTEDLVSSQKTSIPPRVEASGSGAASSSLVELQEKLMAAQMQMQLVQTQILEVMQKAEKSKRSSGNPSSIREVKTILAPAPVGPYSQAVRVGDLVFLSGSLGLNPTTGKLVDGGIIFESGQSLSNIEGILKASGSDKSLVVKSTILLKNISDAKIVNNIYLDFFSSNAILPARTTFAVADLPMGALIEIDVVARVEEE